MFRQQRLYVGDGFHERIVITANAFSVDGVAARDVLAEDTRRPLTELCPSFGPHPIANG